MHQKNRKRRAVKRLRNTFKKGKELYCSLVFSMPVIMLHCCYPQQKGIIAFMLSLHITLDI